MIRIPPSMFLTSQILCLLCLCSHLTMEGQNHKIDQVRQMIFEAYQKGNHQLWRQAITQLENKDGMTNENDRMYELALAKYGLIGYCLATESCQDLDELIDDTEEHLDFLLDQDNISAKAKAMYGALLAMKIGINPAKAIYLGPRSSSYIDAAIKLNPQSPEAWVEMGNMRFHAPSLFGGDLDESIICFEKAVTLFEEGPQIDRQNWLYLHARVWAAQGYEKKEEWTKALLIYQAINAAYPDFMWVSAELLPAMLSRMGN